MRNLYKYLFIALGIFSFTAQAQPGGTRSLTLDVLTPVINSPRVDTMLEGRVIVRNQSASRVDVRITKEYLALPNRAFSQICWASTCFPPTNNAPRATEAIAPLGSNSNFKGDYWPEGNAGTARIKYCFINNVDEADSICTIITFNAGPVSANSRMEMSKMEAFPNPATNFVNLSFPNLNTEARFEVMNLIGKKLLAQQVAAGTNQVSVEVKNFAKGQYFATLTDLNGRRVGSVRFIVK